MIISSLTVLLFLSPTPDPAQTVGGGYGTFQEWKSSRDNEDDGFALAPAGDIDGDGVEDIMVGNPSTDVLGANDSGAVFVYSGADGSILLQFAGETHSDQFGYAVAGGGDINGDGYPDLLVGAPGWGQGVVQAKGAAYAYSGRDGSRLHRWVGTNPNDQFGSSIAFAGDVDLDGLKDILIGGVGANAAFVYSGATGAVFHKWVSGSPFDYLGCSVSNAGDVNLDGYDDVLVGAYNADPGGMLSAGSAYLYSGFDRSLIYQFDGLYPKSWFGRIVQGVGDLNQDGYPDLAVAAVQFDSAISHPVGYVRVYSGADGSVMIHLNEHSRGEDFGQSIAAIGDIDGDGFPDVAIGAPKAIGGGRVDLRSGRDGQPLHSFRGEIGFSVASLDDRQGDGYPEFMSGASSGEIAGPSLTVLGFNPFLRASAETLSASVDNSATLLLSFPEDAAGLQYHVLGSTTGVGPIFFGIDIPLSMDRLLSDSLRGIYPVAQHQGLTGTLDGFAKATATFSMPAAHLASYVGSTLHIAAVAGAPGLPPEYSSVAVAFEIVP